MSTYSEKPETDEEAVVFYQLEKVDQGGEIQDLFDQRTSWVAEHLGLEFNEDTIEVVLENGTRIGLTFTAYIERPS